MSLLRFYPLIDLGRQFERNPSHKRYTWPSTHVKRSFPSIKCEEMKTQASYQKTFNGCFEDFVIFIQIQFACEKFGRWIKCCNSYGIKEHDFIYLSKNEEVEETRSFVTCESGSPCVPSASPVQTIVLTCELDLNAHGKDFIQIDPTNRLGNETVTMT